jgi:hypothetical protein
MWWLQIKADRLASNSEIIPFNFASMPIQNPFISNSFGLMALFSFLLFLQTLTLTSATALPTTDRTNQTIRWVDCHDKVPEPLVPELNLTDTTFPGTLPSNLFCGEMDVPMDYTKPFDTATNNITIGFAMNRPPKTASGLIF